jgi:hypothetical protein
MSEHAATSSTACAEFFDSGKAGALSMLLALGAVVGIVGSIVLGFFNLNQFAFSWLFAFTYFFTLCAGSLFWILVHHAVDAEWSVVVRRILENVASLLPVMVLFFLPVLFCAPILYKWWTMAPGVDEILDNKRGYLNIPFFVIRSGVYFVALCSLALLLKRFSTRQDKDGAARHTINMRRVAFIGIPLFALSLTFGAFDWLMGLDYKWFSTMWGVYIFAGAAGSSISLLVLLITVLRNNGYLKNVVTLEHYHIMGKLMLAFVVFWAYIGFSQYMLIWYANIPEETSYFLRRNVLSWNILSTFLVVGRFFIPFPLLLLQGIKRNVKWICRISAWILFMQLLDIYIVVLPMLHQTGVSPHLLDAFALLGMGSALAFLFIRNLKGHSLFPARDPRLAESIRLTN